MNFILKHDIDKIKSNNMINKFLRP